VRPLDESPAAEPAFGAYGFRLAGLGRDLLLAVDAAWPAIELRRVQGEASARRESLSDESAHVLLRNGGEVVLQRAPAVATFVVPFALGDAELVHPYLAPAAAVFGRWQGRESFHGGGFLVDGAAFGVLGGRRAGKSSLLAYLALQGLAIVADDVLLTDGSTVWAGPRAIDLREETARELGAGDALGKIGLRERWRLTVPAIDPLVLLGGWVLPTWGDELMVRRLPARELLARLAEHRAVLPPGDPGLLLRLAGFPGWELRRPRSWALLAEAAELLREAVAGAGAGAQGATRRSSR
jgi:hypothetical protein